jgi:oxygen-independent coproporphyrinogen-3 oxidase
LLENWQRAGFGVYLHWPYCEAKCPYCDFNSHVVRHIDHDAWRTAYLREIDRWADRLGPRPLASIFFGGGTPSLMQPETVDAVLSRLAERFSFANDIEITLEANPGSVEADKFAAFAATGVNRVSLGVQAINDADLKALGRLHSAAEAFRALDIARQRFDRVSFDVIYARQNQSLADWESELAQVLAFGMDHLSLYQLTIEDGTAFGDRFARGGLKGLPDDALGADLYALTQERCAAAGLQAYEVSNHARPGAESRHNLIYWRGGDYLGIGPGAHGRVTEGTRRLATATHTNPQMWLKTALTRNAWTEEELTPQDVGVERLLMGLRLSEPIDLAEIETQTGVCPSPRRLRDLAEDGLVEHHDQHLQITETGRPLLNAILEALLYD